MRRSDWAADALRLLAALEAHYKKCGLYDVSCELAFDLLELRLEEAEYCDESTRSFRT